MQLMEYGVERQDSLQAENLRLGQSGVRFVAILAELEEAGGSISAPNVSKVIIQGLGVPQPASSLKRPLTRLVARGWAELVKAEAEETLSLTDDGWSVIDYYKRNPAEIPENHDDLNKRHSTFRIVQTILDQAAILPETGTAWLCNKGNDIPVIPLLSQELGQKPDSFGKRLWTGKKEFGYFELTSQDPTRQRSPIINIGVTQKAREDLEEYHKLNAEPASDDFLLDEERVWEAELLTQTCLELADSLGAQVISKTIRQARNEKLLLEMSASEFDLEEARLLNVVAALRRAYAKRFGSQAAPVLQTAA